MFDGSPAVKSVARAPYTGVNPDAPTGSVEAWRTLKRAHDRLGAFLRQTKTPLRVPGDCKRCGGTGRVGTKPVRWCPACRGAGVVNTAKAR